MSVDDKAKFDIGRPRVLYVTCTPIDDHPSTGTDQRMRILYNAFADIGETRVHLLAPPNISDGKKMIPIAAQRDEATKKAVLHPYLQLRRLRSTTAQRFRDQHPEEYDIVFLHRLGACWWSGWTDTERTILDIDDIPSQIYTDRRRYGTLLKVVPRWFLCRYVRWSERHSLSAFRFSLVCSEADLRYLDHPRVAVVPNAFWIPPGSTVPEPTDGIGHLLFVGSLGYPPNFQGLAWFVEKILPRIRSQLPEATLTVVGRTPQDVGKLVWRNAPGVRFLGTVDTVVPYIREAKLEICPLLRGQGTRIKILESLAHGKPVVSTSIGAYGMEIGEKEGLFRRDDPVSFAETCIRLLRDHDHRTTTGTLGRRFVLENANQDIMKRKLHRLVEIILSERGLTSERNT